MISSISTHTHAAYTSYTSKKSHKKEKENNTGGRINGRAGKKDSQKHPKKDFTSGKKK